MIVKDYDPNSHPICRPLAQGGPARLVREYHMMHDDTYADECHLYYVTRLTLIDKFPEYLAPRQVYGLSD